MLKCKFDSFRNRLDGRSYVRTFKCLVKENQSVGEDEVFEKEARPFGNDNEFLVVELVATPTRTDNLFTSISLVPNCRLLATITADVYAPAGEPRKAIVGLKFGKSEIEAIVTNVYSGATRRAQLDYNVLEQQ